MITVVSHYKIREHSYEPHVVRTTSWWRYYMGHLHGYVPNTIRDAIFRRIEEEWNCKVVVEPFGMGSDRYTIDLTDEQAVLFLIKFPNSCEYKLTFATL